MHQDKKGGHFINGFFWGAVLGGGFAYLISTKRGRELLKDLVQDGMDMLEEATMPEQEEVMEAPIVVEPSVSAVEEKVIEEPKSTSDEQGKKAESPRKRFFRKVSRK